MMIQIFGRRCHGLLPSRVISDVAGTELPLESKEGFIRQIPGWREFVHHVHESNDGFRKLPGGRVSVEKQPGDGGYKRWAGKMKLFPVKVGITQSSKGQGKSLETAMS
jgi:deoxyribodipyrimidine photolyase-like uncharacterized protein